MNYTIGKLYLNIWKSRCFGLICWVFVYYTVTLSLSKACKYWRTYVDILDNESSNIIKNNKLCLVEILFSLNSCK